MQRGERVFAILLGLFGLLWIYKSTALSYVDDAVPGSGFLPMWLGIALTLLVALFLWSNRGPAETPPGRIGRVLAIAAALLVTVLLIDPLGFTLPVMALAVFLVRVMERESWLTAVIVGVGTGLALLLIFRVWLAVPLPRGPWGF